MGQTDENQRFLEGLGQKPSLFDASAYFAAEALATGAGAERVFISQLGGPSGANNPESTKARSQPTETARPESKTPVQAKSSFMFRIADLGPGVGAEVGAGVGTGSGSGTGSGAGIGADSDAAPPKAHVYPAELLFSAYVYNCRRGIRGHMSEDLLNFIVRRKEEHYIDKFKNQNALMKKFGEDGIKAYVVLDAKKSMGQMLQESGVPEDKFIEILDFMDHEGMVVMENTVPETVLLRPQSAAQAQPTTPTPPAPVPSQTYSPQQSVSPAQPALSHSPGIQITPSGLGEEEERKAPPPVPGIMRDEHTSTPLPPGYPQGKLLQPKAEVEPELQLSKGIDITHAQEDMEKLQTEAEGPKPEDLLSPLERIIFDKFSQEGVEVYNLIDGEKTAEQILLETGVSEGKLVEILEFMDNEGIIKLEKPGKPRGEPGLPLDGKNLPFEPILDDGKELPGRRKADVADRGPPLMLPVPQKMGPVARLETRLKLSLKYRGKGSKLLSAVDGKRDTVQLSKDLGIPLSEMDKIFASLIKRNAVSLEPVSDDRLKDRYGTDGLKIAHRYGRDGLMVYELIGKEKSIKDVILRSKVEPKRAVDIVLFIHKTLDLGLPIDLRMLYAQLGIKEKPN